MLTRQMIEMAHLGEVLDERQRECPVQLPSACLRVKQVARTWHQDHHPVLVHVPALQHCSASPPPLPPQRMGQKDQPLPQLGTQSPAQGEQGARCQRPGGSCGCWAKHCPSGWEVPQGHHHPCHPAHVTLPADAQSAADAPLLDRLHQLARCPSRACACVCHLQPAVVLAAQALPLATASAALVHRHAVLASHHEQALH